MNNATVEKIKLWVFPSLMSMIGLFIWQEIKEIKSDVKSLLAQSNIDKTRIDNLERQIFNGKITTMAYPLRGKYPPSPLSLMLGEFIPSKNDEDEEKG